MIPPPVVGAEWLSNMIEGDFLTLRSCRCGTAAAGSETDLLAAAGRAAAGGLRQVVG